MSVYNRKMFRGSRPTAQDAQQAVDVGITSVMADMSRGVKAAKNHEQAINAFRGDQKSMKERRQELAGIVGMKDAKKTPESVVTLVQPVMEMRQASEKVDQGIGQVAQQAMNTPVEGKMAGGIMQPLQMKAGGAARLAELYKQNMPVVQDMFGDQSAALKKQALGQLLLGGVAPAGLAIAQGTPVSEALMQLGPYAAQLGAGVQQSKMKQDAAARQAALNLASSQQAAEVAAKAAADAPFTLSENQTRFGPKDPVTGKATVLAEGPKKKDYATVYKLDPTNPMGFVSQDILKSAETPEGFSRSKPEVGGYSVMLNRKTGKLTKGTDLYFSQQPAGTFSKPLDDTIIDVFDAQGKKQKIPYSQYMANISDFTLEDPKEKTTVYPLEDITVGDKVIPAGQSVQLSKTFVDAQPEGTFSTEAPTDLMSRAKVLQKRDENGNLVTRVVFKTEDYEDLVNNQGFAPNVEKQFQYVSMYKMVDGKPVFKTATTFKEQNDNIADGFRPYNQEYKTLGNQVLSISPAGTQVVYTQLESDPATLFNAKGEPKVVNNKQEALAARQSGFHFTKKPEMKGITRSQANALLVDLADDIANGTASPEQLRQFQTSVSVVRDTPRVITGEGGESMVTVGGTVPPFVVEAVRLAKERDPEFNDMGLLDVPVEEISGEQNYEGIIDPTINYAENIGPLSKLSRFGSSIYDFVASLGGADYDPTDPTQFEAVNDIHFLNIITVTRSLKALGGKASNELRQRIESLQVDPYSAGLTKTKLLSSVGNMRSFLSDTLIDLDRKKIKAPSPSSAEKIRADMAELEYLLSQYELLESNLKSQAGSFGTGSVRPQDAPPLTTTQ